MEITALLEDENVTASGQVLYKDLLISFIKEIIIISDITPELRKKASCSFRLLNTNHAKSKEKETNM